MVRNEIVLSDDLALSFVNIQHEVVSDGVATYFSPHLLGAINPDSVVEVSHNEKLNHR